MPQVRVQGKLAALRDEQGTIRVGLVTEQLLFTHFSGKLAADLSRKYEELVLVQLAKGTASLVFCDALKLESSIFAIRAVLRPLLRVRQGSSRSVLRIELLTKSDVVAATARALSLVYGCELTIRRSKRVFRSLLRSSVDRTARVSHVPTEVPKAPMVAVTSAPPPPVRRS